MAHIVVSLYGKACASLITLLADYQIGPFFKTILVMFLDEGYIVAYFATQHEHYLSTLIANMLISRYKFLLNALLHTFLLCFIALYIILHSVKLQEPYILSFNRCICSVQYFGQFSANCVHTRRFP